MDPLGGPLPLPASEHGLFAMNCFRMEWPIVSGLVDPLRGRLKKHRSLGWSDKEKNKTKDDRHLPVQTAGRAIVLVCCCSSRFLLLCLHPLLVFSLYVSLSVFFFFIFALRLSLSLSLCISRCSTDSSTQSICISCADPQSIKCTHYL